MGILLSVLTLFLLFLPIGGEGGYYALLTAVRAAESGFVISLLSAMRSMRHSFALARVYAQKRHPEVYRRAEAGNRCLVELMGEAVRHFKKTVVLGWVEAIGGPMSRSKSS